MGHNLDALFNPENIAVIGASNNPLKAGYTVIYNLNQIGYPKKVFPVTMSADEILGRKCYKKLSQIGYEAGYQDNHYFSYIFKKTQGCTPSEYRKRNRKQR